MSAVSLRHHRTLGLAYAGTAGLFLTVGFLLMLLMRWQLAWPTAPLPAWATTLVTETNAPAGHMLPEFYNQLVAMHGTVMIFLAVVPLAANAFGTYLVPLQIGAPNTAFPRLSAAGYLLYVAAGVLMLAGFAVPGGAANSGWTSYPPLSVIATRGQDLWLVGIVLLGFSTLLHAVTMITTVVQLRAPGLTLKRLPFFVWAQLVTALLLLLAYPSLQAAAVLQLLDRLAGTSFFVPGGLIVGGAPLQGYQGGGNPLLWQHLFWFLAHPEVYVLILPAIGIVAEVITSHARRPLWGYRGMIGALHFLGLMSITVWAHHMFLSGMRPELSAFFQVTTMIISIPSVILVACLVFTLWSGAIRFTVPMLFALAFLPMFGLGGLSGLPLGLAASDIGLHDTYYVVGHFHYLVAPGTLFALFAGIYHWFPTVTGRHLDTRLGQLHFWGSLLTINVIFLPMFGMGLIGVNRRLYDAGLGYAHAQPALAWNVWMTWSAFTLGALQLPFLWNLARSWRHGVVAADNPWHATSLEWTPLPPSTGDTGLTAITVVHPPYVYLDEADGSGRDFTPQALVTSSPAAAEHLRADVPYVPRADSGLSVVRLGTSLVLASQAMLFGSLLSAFVLLRTGTDHGSDWNRWLSPTMPWVTGAMLIAVLVTLVRPGRRMLIASAALSAAVVLLQIYEQLQTFGGPLAVTPSRNLLAASWMVLTGALVTHCVCGTGALAYLAGPGWRVRVADPVAFESRRQAVVAHWRFIGVVWLTIVVAFHLG